MEALEITVVEEPDVKRRRSPLLRILLFILLPPVFLVLQGILMMALRFQVGWTIHGRSGYVFFIILSLALLSLPPLMLFLYRSPHPSRALPIIAGILFLDLLLGEILLAYLIPGNSLLPLSTFSTDVTNKPCVAQDIAAIQEVSP